MSFFNSSNNSFLDQDYYNGMDYSDRPPPPGGPPSQACHTVYSVSVGIILPAGIVFNVLAFAVFLTSPSLRSTTTGRYLVALSVADSTYLVGELLRWMDSSGVLGHQFLDSHDGLCKVTMSMRYTGIVTSAWLTVVITIERLITVKFPLKVGVLSTATIAHVTIGIIFTLGVILGCFPMWTVSVFSPDGATTMCAVHDVVLYHIFNWIVLRTMSLIVPSIFIVTCCTVIIVTLHQARTVRKRSLALSLGPVGSRLASGALENQLTAMLLAVAFTFVLLRLPNTIAYYVYFSSYTQSANPRRIQCVVKITDTLVPLNYASNFFLYCLCGSVFRRELKAMFTCGNRARRDTRMPMTPSRQMSSSLGTAHSVLRPLTPS